MPVSLAHPPRKASALLSRDFVGWRQTVIVSSSQPFGAIVKNESDARPPKAERRPQKRKRTLLAGLVSWSDGAECFDCRIQDLSDGGARITCPSHRPLPARVYLINIRECVAHDASVVWRKRSEGGLKLFKTFSLAEVTDHASGHLKKLWSSRALR